MTVHQSIHNKDDTNYLACSSIDRARFHISCPWFRSSQLRAQRLDFPSCRRPQRLKTVRQLFSAETLCVLLKLLPTWSFLPLYPPATFSNIQAPRDRAAVIVSGLPRSVLAERLACVGPHLYLECLGALLAMTFTLNIQGISAAANCPERYCQPVLSPLASPSVL